MQEMVKSLKEKEVILCDSSAELAFNRAPVQRHAVAFHSKERMRRGKWLSCPHMNRRGKGFCSEGKGISNPFSLGYEANSS